MKICVPVKWSIDTTYPIQVDETSATIHTHGAKMVMDPLSMVALSQAMALRAKRLASEVVAITVGDSSVDGVLKMAFAMGVDRAIRINIDTHTPVEIASQIAHVCKDTQFDVILCGSKSSDTENGQVGAMIASVLGMQYVACVESMNVQGNILHTTSIFDNLQVESEYQTPVVVGVNIGLVESYEPTLPHVLYAKHKDSTVIESNLMETCDIETVSVHAFGSIDKTAEHIDAPKLVDILMGR